MEKPQKRMEFYGGLFVIIPVRFHIFENIVCLAESIEIISVCSFVSFQIGKDVVETGLHDEFFQCHFLRVLWWYRLLYGLYWNRKVSFFLRATKIFS